MAIMLRPLSITAYIIRPFSLLSKWLGQIITIVLEVLAVGNCSSHGSPSQLADGSPRYCEGMAPPMLSQSMSPPVLLFAPRRQHAWKWINTQVIILSRWSTILSWLNLLIIGLLGWYVKTNGDNTSGRTTPLNTSSEAVACNRSPNTSILIVDSSQNTLSGSWCSPWILN